MTAVVKIDGGAKRLLSLRITPTPQPLKELNAFHLLGKGPLQYLFLAGCILTVALTGWAMSIAFKRNAGWRRWLLIVLMPLGLTPSFAMYWNTAQTFVLEATSNAAGHIIPIIAFRYPMTMMGNNEAGAPYFYISAPLIAIGYLIRRAIRGKPAIPQPSL